MQSWKSLTLAGFSLFAVSFLLPVDRNGTSFLEGQVPGWEAMEAALSGLVGPLGVASGLTNFVMLSALLVYRTRNRGVISVLLGLCVCSALLNGIWLLDADRGSLRWGYYLWWLSFILVSLGLHRLWKMRRDYSQDSMGFALFT